MNIKVYNNINELIELNLPSGSHNKIIANCGLNISENCVKTKEMEYRRCLSIMLKNNGVYTCLQCKRKQKLGVNNPNNKYKIPQDMFDNIDSEFKAYLLGWIISDGHIKKNGFTIKIHNRDIDILLKLRDGISKDLFIKENKNNMITLDVNSQVLQKRLLELLKLKSYGEKSKTVCFPDIREDLRIHCIRGIFDGDGSVRKIKKRRSPECSIASSSKDIKESVSKYCGFNCRIDDNGLCWTGDNALDFMGKMYESKDCLKPWYSMDRKFYIYETWCFYIPALYGHKSLKSPEFKILKTDKRAILPSKVRVSDSGYDLTIIEEYKKYGDVILYKTGIKAQVEHGWYLEIIPRSSIIKSGYMLANSVAVIDRSYIGEIFVPLIKIDKNAPDIELPCKLVQLVPKPIVNFQVVEVKSEEDLGYTNRGEKGFGSSDIQ